MKRIGIAASKMAKGNLFFYNLYVVVLSFLLSILLFIMAGFAVLISLLIFGSLLRVLFPASYEMIWESVMRLCMSSLTVVVTVVNLLGILRNVKMGRDL